MTYQKILLIEPVWNRNSRRAIVSQRPAQLLIEPVWNRNRAIRSAVLASNAFNRTSLESKRTFFCDMQRALLDNF